MTILMKLCRYAALVAAAIAMFNDETEQAILALVLSWMMAWEMKHDA